MEGFVEQRIEDVSCVICIVKGITVAAALNTDSGEQGRTRRGRRGVSCSNTSGE